MKVSVDRFETERLVIRELREEDLEAALVVHTSNPEYLALTEGSGGEPGRYDLGMLQRDFVLSHATPGRHVAGVFLKDGGELVGVLDWLEENPADGKPWLGLVIVRADRQRRGFASEAFEGLADQLRAGGARTLRVGVVRRNEAGRAFVARLGFAPVSETARRQVSEEQVVVYERSLARPPSGR